MGRQMRMLAAVFVLALGVRLWFCFDAIPRFDLDMGPGAKDFHDLTDGYIDLAVNLVDHGVFAFRPDAAPSTFRAPGYPLLLAIPYALFRDIGAVALWVNCVASALTVCVLYLLARRCLGPQVGLLHMLPVIGFPLSVYYCARSYSDTVFALFVALYVLSAVRVFDGGSRHAWWTSGLALAAAALTKSVVLLLPGAFALLAVARVRRALPALIASTAIAGGLIGVWTLRNYQVSGAFVPISAEGGFHLLVGAYMVERGPDPGTSYVYGEVESLKRVNRDAGLELDRQALRTGPHLDLTVAEEAAFRRSAWALFRENPMVMVRKFAVNLGRFWCFSSSRNKTWANGGVSALVMSLGLLMLWRQWQRAPLPCAVLLVTCVYFVVIYCAIIVHSCRFVLPILLLMTPLATGYVLTGMRGARADAK